MAKSSKPTPSLDVSIARRAVGLTVGMSPASYPVAFALLEHFNRKTGQCDPSITRLAAMLGLGEATVKRATKELCEERGLFKKASHGGLSNRAKYMPDWDKMKAVLGDWEERMSSGSSREADVSNSSMLICRTAQGRSVEQLNLEPLTLLNKPCGINPIGDGACGNAEDHTAPDRPRQRKPVCEERLPGLWKGQEPEPKVTPSQVVSLVAEEAAKKRWNRAMLSRGRHAYSRFVEWVTPEVSDEATAAEVRRKGSGAQLIIDRMHAAGLVTSDV